MLSCFPTQRINSIGEWLVVPLMNWLLLTFLPLRFVYTNSRPSFVSANGQLLMIDKKRYLSIGGHSAVQNQLVEDMEIARILKKNNHKIITALGGDAVYCRMYKGFKSSIEGFAKNFYPGFNITPLRFIIMLGIFEVVFFLPVILSIINYSFLWIVVIIAAGRFILSMNSRQNPVLNVLLHPVQMIVMLYVGIISLRKIRSKGIEWKGRKVST